MQAAPIGRRGFLVGAGALAVLAACTGSGKDADGASSTAGPDGSDTDGAGADGATTGPGGATTAVAAILLGEEGLLADALALGVRPLASTATVAEAGFQGLDGFDTSEVVVLENTADDFEDLLSLGSEVVVAYQYVVDALGTDDLELLGELTVVPDGSTTEEVVALLAGVFDRQAEADALLDRLAEARARAAEEIPDQTVSVAAIYPGPSVAVFVDGPWSVPQLLLDAGVTLVPDASTEHDDAGRVYLSLENLDLVGGDTVIVLVSETVEGEAASREEVLDNPLWSDLPGPAAGRAHELDRLAYPGVEGTIRLVDDLVALLG